MNKYIKIIVIALAAFLMSSCADPDLSPIITFDQAGKGGYVRGLDTRVGLYDNNSPSTAALDFDVEFIDSEDGGLVNNYSINVEYVDANPANGDNSVPATPYLSFGKSDFGTSVNGKVGMTLNIPLSDVAAALNLNLDDILALDEFKFTSSITLDDGQVFSQANSSAAVVGSAFQGKFNFSGIVTCPIPEDRFSGAYTMTYVGDATTAFGALPYGPDGQTVMLSPVAGSETMREISGDQFEGVPELGFALGPMTQQIDLLCTVTRIIGTDIPLGCGGRIDYVQGSQPDGDFNFDDDSEFTLNITFNQAQECGAPPDLFQITLTKQ